MKFVAGMFSMFVLGLAAAAGLVFSGVVDVRADRPHPQWLQDGLELARESSLAAHRPQIAVPDLDDAALIRQGAGNYDAMCAGCHLAPGMADSELSRGLNPAPPRLTEVGTRGDAMRSFQIIRHGIAASGMPAWGPSMADEYVWGMVAFIRQLPALSPAAYRQLVASSAGHAHGGGESHGHGEQAVPDAHHSDHLHAQDAADHHAPEPAASVERVDVHVHADGSQHQH